VPAFNEQTDLEVTVETLLRALVRTVDDYEIVVVDDGSTDATPTIADRLACRHPAVRVLHNESNMGLGYSYVRGVDAAQKQAAVFVPADNGWPYESLLGLFRLLGRADVVTSYSTNLEVRPLGRRVISSAYTRVLNSLFGHRLRYYNGLTVYPTAFLRSRPVTTFGFGFMAEVLLKALARGLSYVEVGLPIAERVGGESKALRPRNVVSVVATVGRLYWQLRIRSMVFRTRRKGPSDLDANANASH
jgi:glycosyltransferase involved in cell wall biosynthesis